MQLELKQLTVNSLTIGKQSDVDLFDNRGQLLLAKGQIITQPIVGLLLNRQLYTLQYELKNTKIQTNLFSPKLYKNILGSMQRIYYDAHLVSHESLTSTMEIVDHIINEIENAGSFVDFNSLRTFDNYTYVHSINVTLLATHTALQMGYEGEYLRNLCTGALLHDIGKLMIPLSILNKTSGLTPEEFQLIKNHPQQGQEMLRHVTVAKEVHHIVGQHHERWNGKGYPAQMTKRAIDPCAQIVSVADVFDALVADRPYRKGLPPYHALEMIIVGSGTDFAPDIIEVFKRSLVLYPEDSIVTLNTGEIGSVISVPDNNPTRPSVRILFDKWGNYVNDKIIDLLQDLTRFITQVDFNAS